MTKREYYNLEFQKINAPGFSSRYFCGVKESTIANNYISTLLSDLGRKESPYVLAEIENALNSKYYEQYYTLDGSMGNNGLQILPPNALIHNEFEICLLELKEILEEWIEYIKNE